MSAITLRRLPFRPDAPGVEYDVTRADGTPGNQVLPKLMDDLVANGIPRSALLANVDELSSFMDSPSALNSEMARRGFERKERFGPGGREVDYERHTEDGRASQLLRVQWDEQMKAPTGLELDSDSPRYQQEIQCATEAEGRHLDANALTAGLAPPG